MLVKLYIGALMLAAVGEAAITSQTIDIGNQLGSLTAAGVLGVIVVVCLGMLKKIYDDKSASDSIARELSMKAVAAIEKNTEKTEEQIKLLESMHSDISLCRKLNTMKLEKAQSENDLKTFNG